ncbi:MAG TPA: GAF domain-containing protein [Thermoanaerobaculia bacterium]|nr:GAF domain-containing protein [Thermoanaerobaculia bacterium]
MPSSMDLAARLSAIVALQQEILSAVSDPAALTSLIVTQIPEICGGSGAIIELLDGADLVFQAASGTAAQHIGRRLAVSASLAGLCVRENQLIRSDDVEMDPRVDIGAAREIGIRSMIIAPLTRQGGAFGALLVFSSRPNSLDDLDSYCTQLLAGITSAALQQASAFQDQQASEARYRMLFEKNVAGVFRTSFSGHILDCNDAMVGFLGYASRNDLLQQDARDLYRDVEERERMLSELKEKGAMTNIRLHMKKKDGSSITALVNVTLIPALQGEAQVLGTLVEVRSI